MTPSELSDQDAALDQAWSALGGGDHPATVAIGDLPILPSPLAVGELAKATVAACALAAAELAAARGRPVTDPIEVDAARIATAFVSERHLRRDGQAFTTFAPMSAFFQAADGWVRTHANYPHHAQRLRAALGDDVAAAIARLSSAEVEDRVTAAGGLAVATRTRQQWAAHPQGQAVAQLPLIGHTRHPAPVRRKSPLADGVLLPMAGLRVLDLTRVIAGPVATRTLALLGADVLRVDTARYPEIEAQHLDTGVGKRSTLLDLDRSADRAVFDELLGQADVVVTGYRPGTLDRYGLAPRELASRRPRLIVARISAWGVTGPWAQRRGFDSLAQAACGIALHCGDVDAESIVRPGVLPAQALDHGTGYLMAAAIMRASAAQHAEGDGGHLIELALARTAEWLFQLGAAERPTTGSPEPTLARLGSLTLAEPAVRLPGGPRTWGAPARPWGADPPTWA